MLDALNKMELPKIYKKKGKDCFLDPIRKKLIYVTPEEIVRQKVIRYLIETLNVPEEMISVEDKISHYGLESKRRADIIVSQYDSKNKEKFPLTIIECKAPEVLIGESAINQGLDYAEAVNAKYVMITNGLDTVNIYWPMKGTTENIKSLPEYKTMVDGKYEPLPLPEKLIRFNHNELLKQGLDNYVNDIFGQNTPEIMIPCMTNLAECFIDTSHTFPTGDYGLFEVIEDYGIRLLSYGTAGGVFNSAYRSLLIKSLDVIEFVSFGFNIYSDDKTILAVAVDDPDMIPHHALQLTMDNSLAVVGDKCIFTHSGRISVGHIGCGRISELMEMVQESSPLLIRKGKIYLGDLTNNKLWYMDTPEVVSFLQNLITYSLIRDNYRKRLKEKGTAFRHRM